MAIITFEDLQGVEHSVDLDGKFNVAFNCACETVMQAMPDKCVTLLCADPPYGDGNPDNETEHRNQRGRFDRYNDSSQSVNVEREREATQVEPLRTAVRPIQGSGSSDSTGAGRRTRGRSTFRIDHLHSSMRSAERERERERE